MNRLRLFGVTAIAALAVAGGAAAADATMTNTLGMEFVLVQPGVMQAAVFTPACPAPPWPDAPVAPPPPGAAPPGPRDPRNDWGPQDYAECARLVARDRSEGFQVTLAKPYYVGRYEVTQAQWRAVMGDNPSTFKGLLAPGDPSMRPVESVSWADAKAFVAALNRREKTTAYRLPTEFEWEYACRAGGSGQQSWAEIRAANNRYIPQRPTSTTTPPTTLDVGLAKPNAWGLYDMLGGVWEWVEDPYNGKIFPDPKPPKGGKVHVLKGGSFTSDVKNAICATHGGGPANGWDVGFRIVRGAP